jgi:tetratricopeptide (TPR) repeat protein
MPTAATPHRPVTTSTSRGPETSFTTLQTLTEALRRAAAGGAPGGAERSRLVQALRGCGPAVLPTLLRALVGESEGAAVLAQRLLGDVAAPDNDKGKDKAWALRPEVLRRLDALLADPKPGDLAKARVLALQADLAAPLPEQIVLRDPDALLSASVRELLSGLRSDGEISDAVDLILLQVPRPELRGFIDEVMRHGGPAARPLLSALALDPRTPRELVQLLITFTRPVAVAVNGPGPAERRPGEGRPVSPSRAAELVEAKLERAMGLLQDGRMAEAHRRLSALASAHPERPEVQSALGLCLLRLEQPAAAIEPLGRAAELEPGVAVHRFNLATAASLAERPGSCYRQLLSYLAGSDATPGAEQRQAAARDQVERYERSAAGRYPGLPLDEVLLAEEGFETAYLALCGGQNEAAIAGFRAVLARLPRHVPSWGNLGLAYEAVGRSREAARCWRRALQLEPGYALAREHLQRRSAGLKDQAGRLPL